MRTSAVAAGMFAFVATLTPTPNLAEVPTPNTKDYCIFRNELYSFGSVICIGKNRALVCYPPEDHFDSNHAQWRLFKQDLKLKPWADIELGDGTCGGIAGPAP